MIQSLQRGNTDNWFRVNIARPQFFRKRLKLMGFEARGLLVNAHDHVRILAELPTGEMLEKKVAKSALNLKWLGNAGIASANMHWLAIGPEGDEIMITADTGFNALTSREATADISRMIDPDIALPETATSDFALEKNPASLLAVTLFFAFLAFAFFDGLLLNHNELIGGAKATRIFPAFVLGAIPVYWWLSSRTVPSRESWALSMLLSLAVSAAYIPALKRIDQFLSDGSKPYAYRLADNASLQPESPGPPRIDFSNRRKYWAQFEVGSVHYFDLTHGPLGLWQLDHTELDKKLRTFYGNAKDSE